MTSTSRPAATPRPPAKPAGPATNEAEDGGTIRVAPPRLSPRTYRGPSPEAIAKWLGIAVPEDSSV